MKSETNWKVKVVKSCEKWTIERKHTGLGSKPHCAKYNADLDSQCWEKKRLQKVEICEKWKEKVFKGK